MDGQECVKAVDFASDQRDSAQQIFALSLGATRCSFSLWSSKFDRIRQTSGALLRLHFD